MSECKCGLGRCVYPDCAAGIKTLKRSEDARHAKVLLELVLDNIPVLAEDEQQALEWAKRVAGL